MNRAAEIVCSRVSRDPKKSDYPRPFWAAEFSLWFCRRFADAADVYNAAGCMTRVAHYLVHAIFALKQGVLRERQIRKPGPRSVCSAATGLHVPAATRPFERGQRIRGTE